MTVFHVVVLGVTFPKRIRMAAHACQSCFAGLDEGCVRPAAQACSCAFQPHEHQPGMSDKNKCLLDACVTFDYAWLGRPR